MKVKYFPDTDTLHIELSDRSVVETRDINEDVMIDIDDAGRVVGLTIEHATLGSTKLDFSYETISA